MTLIGIQFTQGKDHKEFANPHHVRCVVATGCRSVDLIKPVYEGFDLELMIVIANIARSNPDQKVGLDAVW